MVVAPAGVDGTALRHLPKQMGTAAGGMFLFAGGQKTGTHDLIPGVHATALSYSDATQRRMRELAVIIGIMKMRVGIPRALAVIGTQAQVLIHAKGIHHLPGI